MRYLEITIKLIFLGLAIYIFVANAFISPWLLVFLETSFLLGFVLVLNREESYRYPPGYPNMARVYLMRKIEGLILILFSIIIFCYVY
jgi:hypothetical protein